MNKSDANTYLRRIAELARCHMISGKVVGRDDAVQAVMQSMEEPGLLTLELGRKNLGKTLLKGEAIQRCKES